MARQYSAYDDDRHRHSGGVNTGRQFSHRPSENIDWGPIIVRWLLYFEERDGRS